MALSGSQVTRNAAGGAGRAYAGFSAKIETLAAEVWIGQGGASGTWVSRVNAGGSWVAGQAGSGAWVKQTDS